MSDDADRAGVEEEAFRADSLRRVKRAPGPQAPARKYCECCGERIPKARREAVPGATRCTECQSLLERRVA